jgi:translation initiation factor 6 (eIF-6)
MQLIRYLFLIFIADKHFIILRWFLKLNIKVGQVNCGGNYLGSALV